MGRISLPGLHQFLLDLISIVQVRRLDQVVQTSSTPLLNESLFFSLSNTELLLSVLVLANQVKTRPKGRIGTLDLTICGITA
jgi:hypothetical protein